MVNAAALSLPPKAAPAHDPIRIQLIRSRDDDDRPTYFYLALHQTSEKPLFISLKCKTTDLERYGAILTSGYGEPDEDTRAYIASLLKN